MKKQPDIVFAGLNYEEIETLLMQVKETIAADFVSQRKFNAADLWNIHRKGRTFCIRRNIFLS